MVRWILRLFLVFALLLGALGCGSDGIDNVVGFAPEDPGRVPDEPIVEEECGLDESCLQADELNVE